MSISGISSFFSNAADKACISADNFFESCQKSSMPDYIKIMHSWKGLPILATITALAAVAFGLAAASTGSIILLTFAVSGGITCIGAVAIYGMAQKRFQAKLSGSVFQEAIPCLKALKDEILSPLTRQGKAKNI